MLEKYKKENEELKSRLDHVETEPLLKFTSAKEKFKDDKPNSKVNKEKTYDFEDNKSEEMSYKDIKKGAKV